MDPKKPGDYLTSSDYKKLAEFWPDPLEYLAERCSNFEREKVEMLARIEALKDAVDSYGLNEDVLRSVEEAVDTLKAVKEALRR